MSTPKAALTRPSPDEYASYYEKYISLLPEGNIVTTLEQQGRNTLELLRGLDESQGASRYAADKWSVKEVFGHMIDSERVFAYRALRFARNDLTPLPGYEQDDYVRHGNFDERTLADLAAEFETVRKSSIQLFRSLREEAWSHRGTANENPVTVRALAHIIGGHEAHHVDVIRK